jgi:tRNA1Val (adenine37-N6)-methyltransferase
LQFEGLKIIQNKNLYCFSSDAVLLCNFVKTTKSDTLVDLCSGSGVVGILAQAKNKSKKLVLVEKQKALADMSKRSLELNGIKNAEVYNIDIISAPEVLGTEKYDVVCSNPPYYLTDGKKLTGKQHIDMAKFEITLTFDTLCSVASKLLKYGGKFFVVNDSSRIAELLTTLKKYSLEPKVVEFCFPKQNSNVVLIQATKNGKSGAIVKCKKI